MLSACGGPALEADAGSARRSPGRGLHPFDRTVRPWRPSLVLFMTEIEQGPIEPTNPPPRRHTIVIALLGLIGAAAIVVVTLLMDGPGIEGRRLATQITARFSLALFLVAFGLGPLARLTDSEAVRRWTQQRRGLGLAFANAHFVHLGAVFAYIAAGGTWPTPFALIAAGVGYVVIALMAATSNDWAATRLGPKNWQRLHTFGAYYVWLIFALTYLSRVKEPGGVGYDVLFAITLSVLLLRVFALLFGRSSRTDEVLQQAPAGNR